MKEEINIELIALCRQKDSSAQRKLYGLLLPYLNGICKRYLYEISYLKDVLQESFIKIFKHIDQYDIQKANFKTWSTQIAINTCLKMNQKNKAKKTEEFIVDLHEEPVLPISIDVFSNEELLNWLKKMPIQYYEIYILHIVDGYAHEEIAQKLSINAVLSRKRLSRARAWIKKRVQEDESIFHHFSSN